MGSREFSSGSALPRWIAAWFAADAVVALAPPLYWAFDGSTATVLGIPGAILYFIAVSTCIAASIVAAYLTESRNGEMR
jgi:hypothetical protein